MFRNQFLLAKNTGSIFDWHKVQISDYNLFIHPELDFTSYVANKKEIYLLGNLYDWKNTNYSNQKICEILAKENDNIDDLITCTNNYSGGFVIIAVFNGNIYLFHDASGQNEIYYHTDFQNLASQVKLLEKVITATNHSYLDAQEFYSSKNFLKKRIYVCNSTHRSNILHLMPNHYINVHSKVVCRYFPNEMLKIKSIDQVAEQATQMIKGYLKSMAERSPIAVAVTAGYDSRILFLASLDLDCKYFIDKHANMSNNHNDLTISSKLVSLYDKELHIIADKFEKNQKIFNEYIQSIDFPRRPKAHVINFPGHIYINGNISEIARNYYGYHKKISGEDLCYFCGYADSKYPASLYYNWLQDNTNLFKSLGYNYLDMFYWEERMGNWASKSKTESLAIGKKVISPFNSRALITLMLSVERKYRDSHYNVLYNKIIELLSENRQQVRRLPINPCTKSSMIRIMKKMKIYNLYRQIGLKYRFLK